MKKTLLKLSLIRAFCPAELSPVKNVYPQVQMSSIKQYLKEVNSIACFLNSFQCKRWFYNHVSMIRDFWIDTKSKHQQREWGDVEN